MNNLLTPLPLHPLLPGLTTSQTCDLLKISDRQLCRDVWVCSQLKPLGWQREAFSRGFNRDSLEVLWVFRQLVKIFGRPQACRQIQSVMETIYRERQASSRTNQESA